jgi:hypothetical protein
VAAVAQRKASRWARDPAALGHKDIGSMDTDDQRDASKTARYGTDQASREQPLGIDHVWLLAPNLTPKAKDGEQAEQDH